MKDGPKKEFWYPMKPELAEMPIMILATFSDAVQAKLAKSTIDEMLVTAEEEVDELFEKQDGVAEIDDVSNIYSRYGFRNDCGWTHEHPLIANGENVLWAMPDGMFWEDAQTLLLALGAELIAVQPEIEEYPSLPFEQPELNVPAADGEVDFIEVDEEDTMIISFPEKKILH
jgi:hypothetical protein